MATVLCGYCGTEAPQEKAWCPQCNQPLEPEEGRAEHREMDGFAGTMMNFPRPVLNRAELAGQAKVESFTPVLPNTEVIASSTPFVATPRKTLQKSRGSKASTDRDPRFWVYLIWVVVGGLISLFLLLVVLLVWNMLH